MSHTTTDTLFHHLHQCMNLLHRGYGLQGEHHGRHRCGYHGAHRGQGKVLRQLVEQDGLSQKELAEKLHVRPPSLSEVLDKLAAEAFIERRSHPDDARISTVHITNKGREIFTQVQALHLQAMEECLSDFSIEEKEQLSGLLRKLIRSLVNRDEMKSPPKEFLESSLEDEENHCCAHGEKEGHGGNSGHHGGCCGRGGRGHHGHGRDHHSHSSTMR